MEVQEARYGCFWLLVFCLGFFRIYKMFNFQTELVILSRKKWYLFYLTGSCISDHAEYSCACLLKKLGR